MFLFRSKWSFFRPEAALSRYRRARPQTGGFWSTEIGTLNEVVHLWAFDDLNDRQAKWAKWAADPRRPALMVRLRQIILSQSNKILKPTEFSGLK